MARNTVLAAAVLVLAACQDQGPSEAPGVRGPITIRLWDEAVRRAGLPPTTLSAESVAQEDAAFHRMTMQGVRVRRAMAQGELWAASAKGVYDAGQQAALVLEPPVHVTGILDHQPVAGVAQRCEMLLDGKVLRLGEVELVHRGQVLRSPRIDAAQGRLRLADPVTVVPAPPAVAAVLGALPPPSGEPRR